MLEPHPPSVKQNFEPPRRPSDYAETMKRRASALLLATTAVALTGCDSAAEYDFADTPDNQGDAPQQQSQALSDALDLIDCEGRRPASFQATGLVQAGECVPFAGAETVEYYEFETEAAATSWATADASITDVDGIYQAGAVVIIDRQNDYLLQLGAQFEPAR